MPVMREGAAKAAAGRAPGWGWSALSALLFALALLTVPPLVCGYVSVPLPNGKCLSVQSFVMLPGEGYDGSRNLPEGVTAPGWVSEPNGQGFTYDGWLLRIGPWYYGVAWWHQRE